MNLISFGGPQLKDMDRDTHSCRSGLNDLCSSRSFGGTSHEQERLESIGSFGHFVSEVSGFATHFLIDARSCQGPCSNEVKGSRLMRTLALDHHDVHESLKAGFVIFRSTPRREWVIGKSKLKTCHPALLG